MAGGISKALLGGGDYKQSGGAVSYAKPMTSATAYSGVQLFNAVNANTAGSAIVKM